MCQLVCTIYICIHVAKDVKRCDSYHHHQCFPKFAPNPVAQLCSNCEYPDEAYIQIPAPSAGTPPSPTARQWHTGPAEQTSRRVVSEAWRRRQQMKQHLMVRDFEARAKRMQARRQAHTSPKEKQFRRWFRFIRERYIWHERDHPDDNVPEDPEILASRGTPRERLRARMREVKKALLEALQGKPDKTISWWVGGSGVYYMEPARYIGAAADGAAVEDFPMDVEDDDDDDSTDSDDGDGFSGWEIERCETPLSIITEGDECEEFPCHGRLPERRGSSIVAARHH